MSDILQEGDIKVQQEKEVVKPKVVVKQSLRKLAENMKELKELKAESEAKVKEINKRISFVEHQLLDIMEESDMKQAKFDDLGTFYITESLYTKVEEEPQAFAFLKARGFSDAFKTTIHHQTLRSIAKDMLDEGITIPGVNYAFVKKVGLRSR